MPVLILIFIICQPVQRNPSLLFLSSSFFIAKVMDYSIRGVLNEMVRKSQIYSCAHYFLLNYFMSFTCQKLYIPLDFESRYLGKEIIGVLATRFGKSGMSLLLSLCSFLLGPSFDSRKMSVLSFLLGSLWLAASLRLASFISPQQKEKLGDDTKKRK